MYFYILFYILLTFFLLDSIILQGGGFLLKYRGLVCGKVECDGGCKLRDMVANNLIGHYEEQQKFAEQSLVAIRDDSQRVRRERTAYKLEKGRGD